MSVYLQPRCIKMNDKVERMAATMKEQQAKTENLTERGIRLETALEIALSRPVIASKVDAGGMASITTTTLPR